MNVPALPVTLADHPFSVSPWSMLGRDIGLLFTNSPYLMWIFWPAFSWNAELWPLFTLRWSWPFFSWNAMFGLPFTWNARDELNLRKRKNWRSLFYQTVLLIFYTPAVFMLLFSWMFFGITPYLTPLFGFLFVACAAIRWYVMTRPLVCTTGTPDGNPSNESWMYINGICCDQWWLEQNCEMLARMFGRRIVGVHNRTFGFVFDLLDCIAQRDFGYATEDIRKLFALTKAELERDDIKKVVLIAHSQGGIIASMVVDRLLASNFGGRAAPARSARQARRNQKILSKLEVYTFGSAAKHFHGGHALGRIEHFANASDFIARTGVTAYSNLPWNTYHGNAQNANATGHLLNMHYLRPTFSSGEGASSRLATYLSRNFIF